MSAASSGQPDAIATSGEKELEALARELRNFHSGAAYAKLSAFATRRSSGELGQRAALALGYYDYTKGRYPQAHRWLQRSRGETLLKEYIDFWNAQVDRSLGRDAEAFSQLGAFLREFPRSVMAEQALQGLAETALALNRPKEALVALESEPSASTKPALLFLRARAREQAGRAEEAAGDYLAVYYRFPMSAQAREAGEKARYLEGRLGDKFPAVSLDLKLSRAAALFNAREWREAGKEYLKLLRSLTGIDREQAELREVQCRVVLGAAPTALAGLTLGNPETDAERLFELSQAYRSHKQEAEMLAAVEAAVSRAPSSRWAERALFAAGNYFWVQLDHGRATAFYQRLVDRFPDGQGADTAHWRLAWVSYLEQRPEAVALLEEQLRRYPASPFVADALYWLGRLAERSGNVPLARGYFGRLNERFPESYFGGLAAARLAALGPGPTELPSALAMIPAPPPVLRLGDTIPPAAEARWKRVRALESIAFDASAVLELRAGYLASGEPRLLLEAAEAALEAEHYSTAIVTLRQIFPQLESHRIEDLPGEVWRTAYPLPFRAELERSAERAGLDPMLVAGIVRQESAFEREAASGAGAYGLMQLLPKTAKRISRNLKLRYSRARLFDPEYNLRLGTVYFAGLVSADGGLEAALAAYNAGEDRVASWEAARKFEEPAEFVESIPFTETREYVEIVIRNAAIYRELYGRAP